MYEFIKKATAAVSAAAIMMGGAGMPATAEQEPIRVMCLGDSITDGFWLPGGYRNTLCSMITAEGLEQAYDFVGPNWGGNGYDPQHAGYSGYSIDNIPQDQSISGQRTGISSFAEWLMGEYPADVVCMQIGTNDILSLYELDSFGQRLEGLVDIILNALPADGRLYLATLPVMDATNTLYISEYFFTVESMDAAVENCNTQIRALVEKKQAAGKPVVLADINGVLTKDDLYDGVHPSEAGYAKMGAFWFKRLNEYRTGTGITIPTETTATTTETTTTTTMTTTTETTTVTESTTVPQIYPELPPKGDVNLDGHVTTADAVALAKYLAGQEELKPEQGRAADMDQNGKLNAVDLTLLKRAL